MTALKGKPLMISNAIFFIFFGIIAIGVFGCIWSDTEEFASIFRKTIGSGVAGLIMTTIIYALITQDTK